MTFSPCTPRIFCLLVKPDIIKMVSQHLGISLALEKVEGPSQSLMFLGIVLDTKNKEACLPHQSLLLGTSVHNDKVEMCLSIKL